jgi:hypothetical protein
MGEEPSQGGRRRCVDALDEDGLSACLLHRQLVQPHLFAKGVPLDNSGRQQCEAHVGPDAR